MEGRYLTKIAQLFGELRSTLESCFARWRVPPPTLIMKYNTPLLFITPEKIRQPDMSTPKTLKKYLVFSLNRMAVEYTPALRSPEISWWAYTVSSFEWVAWFPKKVANIPHQIIQKHPAAKRKIIEDGKFLFNVNETTGMPMHTEIPKDGYVLGSRGLE